MIEFICAGSKRGKEAGIGIYRMDEVEHFTYSYKYGEKPESEAEALAVFKVLGMMEEKGITEATVYHNCHLFSAAKRGQKKYPQAIAMLHRINRLKRKGYDITFKLVKKNNKKIKKPYQIARTLSQPWSTNEKIKNVKKQLTKKRNSDGKTSDSNAFNVNIEGFKQMLKVEKENLEKVAVINQKNYVMEYVSKEKANKMLKSKNYKKKNKHCIVDKYDISEEEPRFKWLNIKKIERNSNWYKFEKLLPRSLQKTCLLTTREGGFTCRIAKSVGEKLVDGNVALYTDKKKTKIRMIYHTLDFNNYVRTKYNNKCVYCNGEGKTVEHVVPKSKGGITTLDNCYCACEQCNKKKGNMSVQEFYNLSMVGDKNEKVDMNSHKKVSSKI